MSRVKPRKSSSVQDRPSARAILWRRVRKGVKPAAWVIGGLLGLLVVPALFHESADRGSVLTGRQEWGQMAAGFGFKVKHIVIDGSDTTAPALIETALGVSIGDPILGFSISQAEQRIEQLGPVKQAVIERALPNTIIVHLTEREPFAIWQDPAGHFEVIDRKGDVIADHDAAAAKRADPGLLLVVGAGAPLATADLLAMLKNFPDVAQRVVAAERIDDLRWNLVLKNHIVVKLPLHDPQMALDQLMNAQTQIALLDRPVQVVDLRLPDRLIVQPYPTPSATGTSAVKKVSHT
jgi:cell division protein FtsQ